VDEQEGIVSVYYQIEDIEKLVHMDYEIVEKGIYDEIEKNDSFYIILRKK
jgi:hypothetical protein